LAGVELEFENGSISDLFKASDVHQARFRQTVSAHRSGSWRRSSVMLQKLTKREAQ
jgi:hypothetical protein